MFVSVPIAVTDANFVSSNVPENDYAAWNSGTAYTAGQRVIVVSTHSVYEAVINNTNKNPTTDTGTNWIRVSATNRWKAFDQRLGQPVVQAGDVTYEVTATSLVNTISFFGLAGTSINVTVTDSSPAVIYNEDFSLVDSSGIIDWFEFFVWEGNQTVQKNITNLPVYPGYKISITISGSAVTVGQIVFGRLTRLGYTNEGTIIGFDDFSTKDRNETFGYVTVVERGFSDYVDFKFTIPYSDLGRVESVIKSLRATPAVWLVDPEITNLSSTVYGFQSGQFRAALKSTGFHQASLEIEGLI